MQKCLRMSKYLHVYLYLYIHTYIQAYLCMGRVSSSSCYFGCRDLSGACKHQTGMHTRYVELCVCARTRVSLRKPINRYIHVYMYLFIRYVYIEISPSTHTPYVCTCVHEYVCMYTLCVHACIQERARMHDGKSVCT